MLNEDQLNIYNGIFLLADSIAEDLISGLPRDCDLSIKIFGVACCERLIPNYVLFQKEAGHGDFRPLRLLADFAWECIRTGEVTPRGEVEKLLGEAYFSLDEQDASMAEHAARSLEIFETVFFDVLPRPSHDVAVECAKYVLHDILKFAMNSCADNGISFSTAEKFVIDNHLWIREVSLQRKIIQCINGGRGNSLEAIDLCRKISQNDGVGSLGA